MRLLYVSQYFPPEMGAPAVRVSELARHWRAAGHDVRVLTGFPNHPGGRVYRGYERLIWNLVHEETRDNVPVYRTWLLPAPNRGVVRRSLNYATFFGSAVLRDLWLDFQPDAVIGTSPQLLCALAAARIARRRRVRFLFEVRDLWPESLAAVNACKPDSAMYRLLDGIARRLYSEAWKIVVVTGEFRRLLVDRGIPEARIAVVQNGVDTGRFHPDQPPAANHPALAGKFVVSYIGTLGMAHSVNTILRAAERLRGRPGIHFLIIGNGAERENLLHEHRKLRLANVTFLDQQPWEAVPSYLALSGAAIVHLKQSPLFETVLPSKMFEIMAAGRPVLLGVRGEAGRLLGEAQAGIAFEPESAEGLADSVLRLAAAPDERRRLGRNGRDWVVRHASYRLRAAQYLEVLEALPESVAAVD